MRVLYDSQTFMRQRAGGISRLFVDLVSEFDKDPTLDVQAELSFRLSNNAHAASDLLHRDVKATPPWLPRGVMYAPAWLLGSTRPGPVDLVHHTYYSERFLDHSQPSKHVTTVYDMIPELFAGSPHFTGSHLQKRRYVSECDLVICISESTREDLVSVYGITPDTVHVVPLAVGPGFAAGLASLPGLPSEYVLYVGARAGYKDFALLPQALQELESEGFAPPLVIAGRPLTSLERDDLHQRGLLERTHVVSLNDAELRRAYANSAVVVQTSRYEGFGLTPLEAMASGVPAVAARSSAMPEVGGDVVQYFAPGDAVSLATAIHDVLNDDHVRADLSRLGLVRARQFTPEATAKMTACAYRALFDAA